MLIHNQSSSQLSSLNALKSEFSKVQGDILESITQIQTLADGAETSD